MGAVEANPVVGLKEIMEIALFLTFKRFIMSKALTIFILALFGVSTHIFCQNYSLSVLPKTAQKLLNNFTYIEGGTFTQGVFSGWDSLQFHLPVRKTVHSFHMSRFEVTVGEFRRFYEATGKAEDQPDSSIWLREFPYSYNRPIAEQYFLNPKYINHPVVSVRWEQAVRYCNWKADEVNRLLKNTDYVVEIRLPTEAEWELAALGLVKGAKEHPLSVAHRFFPWDGDFMKSTPNGFQFQCNIGPLRTPQGDFWIFNFGEDKHTYTAPVQSYQPNEYGLYQMAGNVAEWTSDHYSIDSVALNKAITASPALSKGPRYHASFPLHQYDNYIIVKGGSWVDEPFYTQCGVRKIHRPERGSATIGFRPVCVVRKRE